MKTELFLNDDMSASGSLNREQRRMAQCNDTTPRKQGANLRLFKSGELVCHSELCSGTSTQILMRYSRGR